MKRLFLQASAWILCILLATACKNAPQNMNGGSYKTMEVTRGTRTLNQKLYRGHQRTAKCGNTPSSKWNHYANLY